MRFGAPPCDRFRPALVDYVDRRERGPGTEAALDHLDRCEICRRELTEIALTIVALRRVGGELRTVPVPAVPAVSISRLVARRPDPWRWRLQLTSLVTSAAIAAVVVAPRVGVGPSGSAPRVLDPERQAVTVAWRAAEARIAAAPDAPSHSAPGTMPPRYPDGLLRPWKEVFPTDATPRALKPS